MDKKVLLAAALSILILLMWGTLFPPPKQTPVPMEEIATDATQPRAVDGAPGFDAADEPYGRAEAEPGDEDVAEVEYAEAVQGSNARTFVVQTDLFQVELTNEGGQALSWRLNDFLNQEGQPLELLPQYAEAATAPAPLGLRVDDPSLTQTLNSVLYEVEQAGLAEGGERVTFRWSDGRGLSAKKSFAFRDGSYLVDVDVDVIDRGRRLPAELSVGPGFGAQEEASSYYYEAWVYDRLGEAAHEQKSKRSGYSPDSGTLELRSRWAGLEDQYFAALVLSDPEGQSTRITLRPVDLQRLPLPGSDEKIKPLTEMVVSVAVPDGGAGLYVGPKKYRLLETLNSGLEQVVWFFSNSFLAWIAKQIYFGLLWLHDNVIQNYGMAIILATIILRVLLFPLNQYSMVRMKKTQIEMQRLQPKIKSIRNKYKEKKDAESRGKMNQETMELYRKEGVNPMGGITGCLPMLGQFPILIGFYGMLTVAVELRGAPFFGWIQDLSRSDPLYITPLLMGATMFVQQMMAMSKVKDPMQQQQQRFMMIMPVVFTVICLNLPSGLVLYWFVNNVLGIGQQWLVNRHTGRMEADTTAGGGAPTGKATLVRKGEKPPKQEKPARHPKQGQGKRQQSGRKRKIAR